MKIPRRSFLVRLGSAAAFAAAPRLAWAESAPASLPRSTPAAEGVSAAGVLAFLDAAEARKLELHSFMMLRHGRVIAEGWWQPYGRSFRHTLYSLSKSFTSTAVGLLVGDGKLSVEDKVTRFFPGDLPPAVSDHLAAMRVKDLLTMATGHVKEPTWAMTPEENWARAFLAAPVERAPGSLFLYNSGATYMCSAIAQKVGGKSILELLRERIFEPLGIADATWETCPRGICTGGWGLSVPTEALAKFAQLLRQNGAWNGRQLVPAAWVAEATSKHIQQPSAGKGARPDAENDWLQGYGYQFWRCRHGAFRGDGAFGQFAVVLPEQDAVVILTAEVGDMQGELDLVWQHLLPAIGATPDPAADAALAQRLRSLALAVPAPGTSPLAATVSGRTFALEKNALGLTSVRFTFREGACDAVFQAGETTHAVAIGLGQWLRGQTALPGTPPNLVSGRISSAGKPQAVSAAGGWKEDAVFAATLRFHETPHHDAVTCRFPTADSVEIAFLSSLGAMRNPPSDARETLRGRAV